MAMQAPADEALIGRIARGDRLAMQYMGDMLCGLAYLPVDVPVRAIVTLASGAVDALSGCYVDSRDDLAALRDRADEITADGLCKLRIHKPAG